MVHDGLVKDFQKILHQHLTTPEQIRFFNKLALSTIDALLSLRYTCFDAHTTSNCCHGMTLFTNDLISSLSSASLRFTQSQIEILPENDNIETIPGSLLLLIGIYLLTYIGEIDETGGRKSNPILLKGIGDLSTKFCIKIVKNVRKFFSNSVADRYTYYAEELPPSFISAGAPISEWGKYVHQSEIRMDKRGVKYTSSMFSMQIVLSHLAFKHKTLVIINDLMSASGAVTGRYIQLLRGNGQEFECITNEEVELFEPYDLQQSVIVFGGFAISDSITLSELNIQMADWTCSFSRLALACDIYYPQFPQVHDDPGFDSSPIFPSEVLIQESIRTAAKLSGVSSNNPNFFFLSHIFPASIQEIIQEKSEGGIIPNSAIFTPLNIVKSF